MKYEEGAQMPHVAIDLNDLANAPFCEQVLALRELFGLTQKELAQLLNGVSERTVSRWEHNGVEPHGQNTAAVEALRTIAETLGDVFEPKTIRVWIDKENPALSGQRPRDFVKKGGGIYRLAALLGANGR